jgi:hypothetical protein
MTKCEIRGPCCTYGGEEGARSVLVGKPEGKRPLERSTCRRGIILKLIINKSFGMDWTGLIWIKTSGGLM